MGGEKKRKRETEGIENGKRCNKRREGLFQEAHHFLAGASTAKSCSLWLQQLINDYDSYDFSKEEIIMMNRVIEMVKAKVLSMLSALPVENSRV